MQNTSSAAKIVSATSNEFELTFQPSKLLRPPVARAAYSDRTAWLMAECSRLAYIHFEENVQLLDRALAQGGFERVALFNVQDTQAFLVKRPDMAVLAFRGTEQTERDILTDMNIRFHKKRGFQLHEGFWSAYKLVGDQVREAVDTLGNTPLYVTGHSLGGALATVATWKLQRDNVAACYTFGSPRVGNGDFDRNIKAPVYRLVNSADIITRVPFMSIGYQHVGDLKYLSSKGEMLRSPSSVRMFARFCLSLATGLKSPFADHSISEYCRKLANHAIKRNT